MIKNILFYPVIIFLVIFNSVLATTPKTISLSKHLIYREKLHTDYREITLNLSDHRQREALKAWNAIILKDPSGKEYLKKSYNKLKGYIWNKEIINLALHYYYINNFKMFSATIEFYFFSMATYLWEAGTSPTFNKSRWFKKAILASSKKGRRGLKKMRTCLLSFQNSGDALSKKDSVYNAAKTCLDRYRFANMREHVFDLLSQRQSPEFKAPEFVKSYSGYIPGNKVELLTLNRYDADSIIYIGELMNKLFTTVNSFTNKKYIEMTIEDFKGAMVTNEDALTKFFTTEEGFPNNFQQGNDNFHKTYDVMSNGYPNMFSNMYESTMNAKESVYINMFFLGGSMGNFLAKALIKKVQQNPNLKVFIITDIDNSLQYKKELDITYNFLRAYSEKFPEDRIIMLPANISLKRTAMPAYVDLLITDETLESFIDSPIFESFKEKLNIYPKAKSDHSKVIIVDGKNPKIGVAFVGSKNFTDTSGAVCYDEVAKIQGPAVGVILDSFYYDSFEALKQNYRNNNVLSKSYCAAFSNNNCSQEDTLIYSILEPFDIMGRNSNDPVYEWEVKGKSKIQIGQNNVYGTIRSALEQDIEAILSAKRQIIISDQYLYDPKIISALRHAILNNSSLNIYIIIEDLSNPLDPEEYLGNIANSLFLPDLIMDRELKNRIKVKLKTIPKAHQHAIEKMNNMYGVPIDLTYHLKSLSVDGVLAKEFNLKKCQRILKGEKKRIRRRSLTPILITGSANKDNMTLSGGFREFQIVIYDDQSSTRHDCLFWIRWNDPTHSKKADPFDFKLPEVITEQFVPETYSNLTLKKRVLDVLKKIYLTIWNFEEIFL